MGEVGDAAEEIMDEGRNGRWHGPFNTFSEARNYAQNLNRTVSYCGFCKPEA